MQKSQYLKKNKILRILRDKNLFRSRNIKKALTMIELGGNITLVGFKELDYAEMVVIKKIVGNYARRFSDREQMNNLTLSLKQVHRTNEDSSKFEMKAKMDMNGTIYNSELVEYNLFIAIDSIMKKLETQINK
jgi:ribosome-associated translation inhibitor RaiA